MLESLMIGESCLTLGRSFDSEFDLVHLLKEAVESGAHGSRLRRGSLAIGSPDPF
jgi:hypothetical protein